MARREPRLTKRERKAQRSPSQRLEQAVRARAEATPGVPVPVYVGESPGMRNMSEVLMEWAAPLLEPLQDGSLKSFQNALEFAGLVWTEATLQPDDPAEVVMNDICHDIEESGVPTPPELRELVTDLIEIRRSDYADDPRIVLTTVASDEGGERKVNVASAMPKGAMSKPAR